MQPDTITRQFRPTDSEPLIALWQEVLPSSQPWNDPRYILKRKRRHNDDLIFVAERNGVVVGAVIAGYDGIRGWIYSLAVLPDCRRCGIGRQLLRKAESALIELGCPKVNLQVRSTNAYVIEFYKRCGYLVEDRASLGKPLSMDGLRTDNGHVSSQQGSIDSNPTKEEISYLHDRLDEFNAQQTGRNDFKPVRLVVRDADGAVIGGLKGITGWDWLYVEILWVHEKHRHAGFGTKLLLAAESEARARGCTGSCLSSFTFQAPGFYERHGYSSFGQIDQYPPGNTMFFFSKQFSNEPRPEINRDGP